MVGPAVFLEWWKFSKVGVGMRYMYMYDFDVGMRYTYMCGWVSAGYQKLSQCCWSAILQYEVKSFIKKNYIYLLKNKIKKIFK